VTAALKTVARVARTLSASVADAKQRPGLGFAWNGDHDFAFPDVNPMFEPYGSRVVVQIRNPMKKTKSGLILPEDTQDTEKWNTQVALVRAVGPLAFCNRETMQPWAEGIWCDPGEFVRVPKYGGDRWEVPMGDAGKALFVVFNDLDIVGRFTGDPLAVKAFI